MPRTLRFGFDYISSNAYLAWTQLPALEARFELRVEPEPLLFAGLLGAHGQLGPAEVAPKAAWMWKNCLRKAALLGVPLRPAVHHPFNPLLALRVSGLRLPDDARRRLVTALFEAVWARRLHVSEPAVVAAVATACGLDGEALVATAGETAAKAALRERTDAAVARGVFGVPSFEVEGELFWGYDDLPWLERFLAGEDPLDRAKPASDPTSGFGTGAPSAWRRGVPRRGTRRQP